VLYRVSGWDRSGRQERYACERQYRREGHAHGQRRDEDKLDGKDKVIDVRGGRRRQ